jgi:guanylate kinase
VVLEIEVQGARQVRAAMPDAVAIFIAPPDPDALRERLEGRGTDDPGAIEARLTTASEELAAQDEFPHVVVNDALQKAAGQLEALVREQLSLQSDVG